jgi:hypothetical protein
MARPAAPGRPPAPRIGRILEADIFAYLSLLAILFVGVMALILQFRHAIPLLQGRENNLQGQESWYLGIAGLIVLGTLGMLVERVRKIRRLFRTGRRVTGQITRLWLRREWAEVRYVYLVQGQRYEIRRILMKNRRLLSLRAGSEITVIVDPGKPERSLIEELYR